MAFETKELSGALFRNDRKESEQHPDYNGNAKINNIDYWLNGWIKQTKTGAKYLSLSFKRKEVGAALRP